MGEPGGGSGSAMAGASEPGGAIETAIERARARRLRRARGTADEPARTARPGGRQMGEPVGGSGSAMAGDSEPVGAIETAVERRRSPRSPLVVRVSYSTVDALFTEFTRNI